MTNQEDKTDNVFSRRATRIVMGVFATIILGAIGSGVWDILFKPGINSVGKFITGLSSQMDNAVFTTATLDPLPLPGLILILILSMIPLFFCLLFLHYGFIKLPFEKFIRKKHSQKINENDDQYKKRLIWRIRIISSIGLIFSLLIYFAVSTAYSVMNESILVWRTFHRNIEISTPYMTPDERVKTISLFRSMKTRSDFIHIQDTLSSKVAPHNIQLEWYEKRK